MSTTFYNETWFWTGAFPVLSAACTGLFYLLVAMHSTRSRARLERLRMHESEVFAAYRALYEFLTRAQAVLYPPDDPQGDFVRLMKNHYFETVKPKMLFFAPSLRSILEQMESQYHAIGDPDAIAEPPFDTFIRAVLPSNLEKLARTIEARTDRMLHVSK